MIVRTKIIGHYSLFVTHYSLLGIQTPKADYKTSELRNREVRIAETVGSKGLVRYIR